MANCGINSVKSLGFIIRKSVSQHLHDETNIERNQDRSVNKQTTLGLNDWS
jgi:hypothetical protein